MDKQDASAQLHPPADDAGDNPAPNTMPPAAPKRRGRPPLPPGQKGRYTRRLPGDPKKAKPRPKARARVGNEAAQALAAGAESRRDRAEGDGDEAPPNVRVPGWLRVQMEAEEGTGSGRAASQLRHLAMQVLERDALVFVQELLADPTAKDTDKLRAVDFVAKLSVGYITPDMAGAEDVPDLPPPIIMMTDGELPGGSGVSDDALAAENADAEGDTGGPQLATVAPNGGKSAGPIPHMGVA